jgi:CheY-like chemotaxis protein
MKALEERKVFIVEDNEMHSMMMDYLLSKENPFQIFRFKSGEECLQRLSVHPDIIILDYGLPGMNGMETFEKIKKYDSRIPVVVVTENRNLQVAEQFLNAGAYDYVLKEQNAFNKLNGIIDRVFQAIAKKEYDNRDRITLLMVGGFILLIILSSIISYLALKH